MIYFCTHAANGVIHTTQLLDITGTSPGTCPAGATPCGRVAEQRGGWRGHSHCPASGDAGQVPPASQEILLLKESEISNRSASSLSSLHTHPKKSSDVEEVNFSDNKLIEIKLDWNSAEMDLAISDLLMSCVLQPQSLVLWSPEATSFSRNMLNCVVILTPQEQRAFELLISNWGSVQSLLPCTALSHIPPRDEPSSVSTKKTVFLAEHPVLTLPYSSL